MLSKRTFLAATAGAICAAIARIGRGAQGPAVSKGAEPGLRPDAELREWYADLNARFESLTERFNLLSRFSPPVGTVMAFAGEWDESRELELGWMACNGRALKKGEYPELYESIKEAHGDGKLGREYAKDSSGNFTKDTEGKLFLIAGDGDFNLPDFNKGYFLRGLDTGDLKTRCSFDPDEPARFAIRSGGNAGNRVGSVQHWATAKPKNEEMPFRTNTEKAHDLTDGIYNQLVHWHEGNATIKDNVDASANEPCLHHMGQIKNVPEHAHTIDSGGDKETRPLNIAVHWIIKARSNPNPPPAR